jgi:hypothetical protein
VTAEQGTEDGMAADVGSSPLPPPVTGATSSSAPPFTETPSSRKVPGFVSAIPRALNRVPELAAAVPRAATSLPRAVGSLYERAIDRVLARPYQVATADEARALLDDPETIDVSAFADQIQQIAIVAVPIMRRVAVFRRLPGMKKVPWVLSIVTVANVSRAIRQGVREVQVVGSYLGSRLHAATGEPPDHELVKHLTVQLYLSPTRRPRVNPDERVEALKLFRRWMLYGLVGRTTNKSAVRAVSAVERLDVGAVLAAHGR